MTSEWSPLDTTTHQDHVIAHVIGATVLGYLILDEAIHILLDIGFIWKIYVDGEMGLLPHPVAVGELETDQDTRTQISAEIDRLLSDEDNMAESQCLKIPPARCLIAEVSCYKSGERLRIVLTGEEENLAVETSMSGEITPLLVQ